MANTYFELETINKENIGITSEEFINVDVSLTAFVGEKFDKSIQLTVGRADGTPNTSFIQLTSEEAKRLAMAILERVEGKISATGEEKSEYTD